MSRKSSAAWLVGLLLVVSAVGFAAFLIPYLPCGSCDGLSQALHMRTSPSWPPTPPPHINCPDCSDRGRVSLFRAIKPSVSLEIAAIVQASKDAAGKDAVRALKELLKADGRSPESFLLERRDIHPLVRPEFIEADGNRYLVLFMTCTPVLPRNEPSCVTVMLLSFGGHALDCVHLVSALPEVAFHGVTLQELPSDGARITLNQVTAKEETRSAYRLYQWEKDVLQGYIDRSGRTPVDRFCRLGVQGNRFRVIAPVER